MASRHLSPPAVQCGPPPRRESEGATDAATAPNAAMPIRLADYPVLRDIAWSTDPTATLSADETFALYERQWRHIINRRWTTTSAGSSSF